MDKIEERKEQTKLGKILGWVFGIILCSSIFSVFDKEIGLLGLGYTVIGVLLLPPVNMRLRCKYQDFVRSKHGEKYSVNLINFGYASMKITLAFVLLILLAAISTPSSDITNNSSNNSQTLNTNKEIKPTNSETQTQSENKTKSKISYEYKNALIKAKAYSKTMHMSKSAIYEQLTSEYGEQFPADAAQYAIDNLEADYQQNALAKAKTYQSEMNMSKNAIYEQLISEYGEKFTANEAQYAIDHLND